MDNNKNSTFVDKITETITIDTTQTQDFIEWIQNNNQKAEKMIKDTTAK